MCNSPIQVRVEVMLCASRFVGSVSSTRSACYSVILSWGQTYMAHNSTHSCPECSTASSQALESDLITIQS